MAFPYTHLNRHRKSLSKIWHSFMIKVKVTELRTETVRYLPTYLDAPFWLRSSTFILYFFTSIPPMVHYLLPLAHLFQLYGPFLVSKLPLQAKHTKQKQKIDPGIHVWGREDNIYLSGPKFHHLAYFFPDSPIYGQIPWFHLSL